MVFTLVVILAIVGYFVWRLNNRRTLVKTLLDRNAFAFPSEKHGPFVTKWLRLASEVGEVDTYEKSQAECTKVLQQLNLTVDDLVRTPKSLKVIHAHRLGGAAFEGGIGTRLSAHLNLFAGTVANLGDHYQQQLLNGILERGELGCFALTEVGAGVLSGLVVETLAKVQPDGSFVMTSPTDSSRKAWISNGLCAKWGAVIARLILRDGTDKGPHAFLVDLETPGIVRTDMPRKTTFYGLDNAFIEFQDVALPRQSMLAAISYVDATGAYKLKDAKVPFRFLEVAQRLLSGRICLSGAALGEVMQVSQRVEEYAAKRNIPTGKTSTVPLSELPCMQETQQRIRGLWSVFNSFVKQLEDEYVTGDPLTPDLVDRISSAKMCITEFALESVYALKARVGAYALDGRSPFGSRTDLLYTIRFAEGDSAILKQKKTRDILKVLQKNPANMFALVMQFFTSLVQRGSFSAARLAYDKLALSVKLLQTPKDKQVPTWLASYESIERIAITSAYLQIYNSVRAVRSETDPAMVLFKDTFLA